MLYLLDTNTCIAAMRQHPVLRRMAAVPPADCAISSITSYELFTGVEKCADRAKERAKVDLLLATISEQVFDGEAAREAGRIRALLESQGCMIGAYDVLLAGHARSAGLTLVTANTAEFSRVPDLRLEDWHLATPLNLTRMNPKTPGQSGLRRLGAPNLGILDLAVPWCDQERATCMEDGGSRITANHSGRGFAA